MAFRESRFPEMAFPERIPPEKTSLNPLVFLSFRFFIKSALFGVEGDLLSGKTVLGYGKRFFGVQYTRYKDYLF